MTTPTLSRAASLIARSLWGDDDPGFDTGEDLRPWVELIDPKVSITPLSGTGPGGKPHNSIVFSDHSSGYSEMTEDGELCSFEPA